jgi:hypothetical protein
MRLVSVAGGVAYRLRSAVFEFSGPVRQRFNSDDESEAVMLYGTLQVGSYSVLLRDGWTLERDDAEGYEPVEARLVSPNPADVNINLSDTAVVAYEFETAAGRVTFNVGNYALSIGVSDPEVCPVGGQDLLVDDGNPCTIDRCANGVLTHSPAADGTACDDRNACTAIGSCRAGACADGEPLSLPELDRCGQARCEPETGNIYREEREDCLPRIQLSGAADLRLDCGQEYQEPGVTASDREDGELYIPFPARPNTSQPGRTVLTYEVSDSMGNTAEAKRTVTVCGEACQSARRPFSYLAGDWQQLDYTEIPLSLGG